MKDLTTKQGLIFLFLVIFGCMLFVILDKYFEGRYRLLLLCIPIIFIISGCFLWGYVIGNIWKKKDISEDNLKKPLSKDPIWYGLWIICILLTVVWLIWGFVEGLVSPLGETIGFQIFLLRPIYVIWILIPIYWYKNKTKLRKKRIEEEWEKLDEERKKIYKEQLRK